MSTQRKVFLTAADEAALCVLAELLSRGTEVTVLSPKPFEMQGCRIIVESLENIHRLVNEISLADCILHLARSGSSKQVVPQEDIMSMAYLLDAWRTGSFIYLSSLRVRQWPRRRTQLPWHFAFSVHPAQRSNELQLRLASTSAPRMAAVILRRGFLISGSDRSSFMGFIYRLCGLGSTFVFESESALEHCGCSFIGGTDLGRAVVDALTIRSSGTYYVACGFCTWRSLIETINRCAGTQAKIVVRPHAELGRNELHLPQSRVFLDAGGFQEQTGFVPQQSFERLIEEYVRAERTAAAKSK